MRIEEKANEKEKEVVNVTDMTGDMTDAEFEQIVEEVHERVVDPVYMTGKERMRKMLDKNRADLLSMQSMELSFKFEYGNDYFSQILGRIRRKK